MRLLRCLAAMLVLLAPMLAFAGPRVGHPAPPLAFEKLFNAPPTQNTSWKSLEGKLVLVDFWATWCGPCIASFPHVRELAAEVKGEPIAFVFVSIDDTPEIVEEFLAKNELPGWVGVDSLQSVATAFGVRSYPTAVLVSPMGTFLGFVDTSSLTADKLRQQLASEEPLPFTSKGRGDVAPFDEIDRRNDRMKALFRVSRSETIRSGAAPGVGLTIEGATAAEIYADLTNLGASRFRGLPLPKETRFDLFYYDAALADSDWAAMYEGAHAFLDRALHHVSVFENAEEEVLVLRLPNGWPAGWGSAGVSGRRWENGVLSVEREFPVAIAESLERRMNRPVLFDLPDDMLGKPFAMELRIAESHTPEEYLKALEEQHGVTSATEKREISVLRFKPEPQ